MLKKHAASLMIIMTLILCGISSAAAISELEAALRSDHTWDEYEITARAGDYAVISSKDRNLLVTMDRDWRIIAWPDAVYQPTDGHRCVFMLPLHGDSGFQLIYGDSYLKIDECEYFIFDDRCSDASGELMLRKAKIGEWTVYRIDDRPEDLLREHILNFGAAYGITYSDERTDRCVGQLIEMAGTLDPDQWDGAARVIFMRELNMSRTMVFEDALMKDTWNDLNAIRLIYAMDDAADGNTGYLFINGEETFRYSGAIALSSFSITDFLADTVGPAETPPKSSFDFSGEGILIEGYSPGAMICLPDLTGTGSHWEVLSAPDWAVRVTVWPTVYAGVSADKIFLEGVSPEDAHIILELYQEGIAVWRCNLYVIIDPSLDVKIQTTELMPAYGDTSHAVIDYGTSEHFTRDDMDAAIAVIMAEFGARHDKNTREFSGWAGYVLNDVSYYSDEQSRKVFETYARRYGRLDSLGRPYTDGIYFHSSFKTPMFDDGWTGLEFGRTYSDYGWTLLKTQDGEWEIVTAGY